MNSIEVHRLLTKSRAPIDVFAECLRHTPGVIDVHVSIDQPDYSDSVEAYIDAELANGCCITWWLDVQEEQGRWRLSPRITGNDSQGQFTFKTFTVQTA